MGKAGLALKWHCCWQDWKLKLRKLRRQIVGNPIAAYSNGEVAQYFVYSLVNAMFGISAIKSGKKSAGKQSSAYAMTSFPDLGRVQLQAGLAKLHIQLEADRRKQSKRLLVGLWPVLVGILLALLAPAMSEGLSIFQPWGMGIVFPFVVLSGRPELRLGGSIFGDLPHVMLYAQFPIEGLLARSLFQRHYTSIGVAGRLICVHVMAAVLLILVSGALG